MYKHAIENGHEMHFDETVVLYTEKVKLNVNFWNLLMLKVSRIMWIPELIPNTYLSYNSCVAT